MPEDDEQLALHLELKYFDEIECVCLIMTREYPEGHGDDVMCFGNVVEQKLFVEMDINELFEESEHNFTACLKYGLRDA